jgi:hypothetical protein
MTAEPRKRDDWFRWVFRVAITLAAAVYLFQAVSAGQFLDGDYAFLGIHQLGTTVADALMFVALVSTGCLKWVARGPVTPFLAVLATMAVSQGQAAAGAARLIWLHVPLGVVLIGLAGALAWGAWAAPAWQESRR